MSIPKTSRRNFVRFVSSYAAASASPSCASLREPPSRPAAPRDAEAAPIAALAFDAFPIFDPRPIASRAEALLPGRGGILCNLWRERQFAYSWLRGLGRRYRDFWHVTEDSLTYAARSLAIPLSARTRDELLACYGELPVWPDVPQGLAALRANGLKLGLLSNFTQPMLAHLIARNELTFDFAISTDAAETYKPDPRAYALGMSTLALAKERIGFVAFAGWDAAGASWFGYPTYWLNRANAALDELDLQRVHPITSLQALAEQLRRVPAQREQKPS